MNRAQNRLRRERRIKLFSVIGLVVITLTIILTIDNMLLSFVLAFVATYLVSPLVNALERMGLSRTVAILIPFVGTGILIGVGIYWMLPTISSEFVDLRAELPKYIDGTTALLQDAQRHFHGFLPVSKIDIGKKVENYLLMWTQAVFDGLPSVISKLLTTMMLAPFFAFFMLQDGRSLSRTLVSMVPNDVFELSLHLQHQINRQMGDFVRARLLEALIVGLVVWLGLAAIQFPYAPFLALFALVTNLIPYVGPIIGAVPGVVIALINHATGFNLLLVTGVYFFAQLIDALFIIPLVVAKIVDLHPVTVVIVIIIGAQVMGILGMVISIPVASVIKLVSQAVYRHVVDFRPST